MKINKVQWLTWKLLNGQDCFCCLKKSFPLMNWHINMKTYAREIISRKFCFTKTKHCWNYLYTEYQWWFVAFSYAFESNLFWQSIIQLLMGWNSWVLWIKQIYESDHLNLRYIMKKEVVLINMLSAYCVYCTQQINHTSSECYVISFRVKTQLLEKVGFVNCVFFIEEIESYTSKIVYAIA